jgi:hypothetical protein
VEVLSLEEIHRQKALESLLKARAAKAAAEPGVQQPHSPQSYTSSRSSVQQDGKIEINVDIETLETRVV